VLVRWGAGGFGTAGNVFVLPAMYRYGMCKWTWGVHVSVARLGIGVIVSPPAATRPAKSVVAAFLSPIRSAFRNSTNTVQVEGALGKVRYLRVSIGKVFLHVFPF
jgi:hypothetical protein